MQSVLPMGPGDPAVAVRNWGNLSALFGDQGFACHGVPSYQMNGPSAGTLSLTLEAGADPLAGMVSADANTLGYYFAAPPAAQVPEPAGLALMRRRVR